MGYCHYWGRPIELSADRFTTFVEECKKLRKELGIPKLWFFGGVKIGSSYGYGEPIFNNDTICFNGSPACETMLIHRIFHHPERETGEYGLYWDFVKTNQEPYDVLVVAVLLSLKYFFPEIALYSDGGREEWKKGIELYEKTTARKVPDFKLLSAPHKEGEEK